MEECLASIKVPTLVVWGDECINVMDKFGFEVGVRKHEVKEMLEKAEQLDVEEASLQLINQKADVFAAAVEGFLARA